MDNLNELTKNIEKLEKSTSKWSKTMAYLTALMLLAVLAQVFFMIKDFVATDWHEIQPIKWIIGILIFFIIFIIFANRFAKDINKDL